MKVGDRLAAMDLGTNSFHLVVAEVAGMDRFNVLTRDKEVVRLGTTHKDMKHITPEAMERALTALKRFKQVADSFNAKIRAVATSATREAKNREEFILRAYEETGIEIEVISGYEEGRLIYLGVMQALNVYDKKILLIDIGGGSTEFFLCHKGNIVAGLSQKLGAVRLTNKFFKGDKIKESVVEEAREFIKGEINPIQREFAGHKFDMAVGTSGTMTSVGLMILKEENPDADKEFNLNNFTYDRDSFFNLLKIILKCGTTEKIKEIPGMDESRADIIVAGVLILEQVFEELNVKKITLSSFALREGILLDTIQEELSGDHRGHLDNVKAKSVFHLAENSNFDKAHSVQVAKLAGLIFDTVKDKLKLTEKEKEYLEAASILHDIGYHISHSKHHKHSYYLIRNAEMLGFNDREIEIISNIARYHRKSHPKPSHYTYNKLKDNDKRIVRLLAGILRIADGLDRSHRALITDPQISLNKNKLTISINVDDGISPDLELWGADRKKALFEEATGYEVEIIN
ncbi:MAG: Ppx/GppA family phosphatase [Ignavibacteriae bacterium]|nr:Ppx/GppA family phosphatase [Ignavibacteriota bacterium]